MSDVINNPVPETQIGSIALDLESLFVQMKEEALEQLDDSSSAEDIIVQVLSVIDS